MALEICAQLEPMGFVPVRVCACVCVCERVCRCVCASGMLRKLPVVLPHELINWLVEKDAMPEIRTQDTAYYWQHMAQHADWAKPCKDWRETHPLFLWGDDAVYNKQRDKVVAVALGFVLDERKSSLHTLFPLFTYKFESRQQWSRIIGFCCTHICRFCTLNWAVAT